MIPGEDDELINGLIRLHKRCNMNTALNDLLKAIFTMIAGWTVASWLLFVVTGLLALLA